MRCRAERDEASLIWAGKGSYSGRGGREGERDVSQATSRLFYYRCWDVEVAVVDFSRQRRSTR